MEGGRCTRFDSYKNVYMYAVDICGVLVHSFLLPLSPFSFSAVSCCVVINVTHLLILFRRDFLPPSPFVLINERSRALQEKDWFDGIDRNMYVPGVENS